MLVTLVTEKLLSPKAGSLKRVIKFTNLHQDYQRGKIKRKTQNTDSKNKSYHPAENLVGGGSREKDCRAKESHITKVNPVNLGETAAALETTCQAILGKSACLTYRPYRPDNLSSVSRAHRKMDKVAHICNLSTPKTNGGAETELPGSSLPSAETRRTVSPQCQRREQLSLHLHMHVPLTCAHTDASVI